MARIAASRGHKVTSLSRRGAPEKGGVDGVTYVSGDATDPSTIRALVSDCDAVVHAVGLLFDATTPGGGILNLIVSGSKSRPGAESTYDAITRVTAFNALDACKQQNPFSAKKSFLFVSAAEAGWPQVSGGPTVEKLAPAPLKRYLEAKRAVESRLLATPSVRPVIYRPSLIWDWKKIDVLPIIPIFNAASALGVPFVDKTIRVETLAAAIVAGVENQDVAGVQRFPEMEDLATRL